MGTSRLAPRCTIVLLAWAAAVPGSAASSGFHFFAGSDLSFEHQESLRIASVDRSIRVRDARGAEEESVYREDPALLNRKFDLLLELDSASVDLALDLPGLRLPGAFRLQPTLLLQAGVADVDLDFQDRTLARDSTSLGGRGPLFGTSLELAVRCASCPWLVSTEYRFQRLPRMMVDSTPSFDLPFEILADEVRLERDVQEVSTRIGYGFSNGILSYVGASHRWSNVEIEDGLRYVDPFGTETTLSSRFKLDSEVTLGIALGEEDWVVRAQVVYRAPMQEAAPPGDQPQDPQAREIARAIAPNLAAIEEAFLQGWRNLQVVKGPDGRPAYLARDVEDLLNKTEDAVIAALRPYPELEGLRDWVSDQFGAARKELDLAKDRPQVAGPVHAAYAVLLAAERTIEKERTDAVLGGRARNGVGKPRQWSQEERLKVTLRFETDLGPRTKLWIFPRKNPNSTRAHLFGRGDSLQVYLGAYSFKVLRRERTVLHCDALVTGPDTPCPLDLISNRCDVFRCDDQECHCQ